MEKVNIFWFRRDLRLHDNHGLFEALNSNLPVLPIFIFDREILKFLETDDRRVPFIHQKISSLNTILEKENSSIECFYSTPIEVFKILTGLYNIECVFTNDDYEPYAIKRDNAVLEYLSSDNIQFKKFKDHVIFEKSEIIKENGEPYTVFTPYSKKWKAALSQNEITNYPSEKLIHNFFKNIKTEIHLLKEMGFEETDFKYPPVDVEENLIKQYAAQRNFPGINGTSKLGIHLRFGTISTRQLAKQAISLSETFLNELIWREFYQMIIYKFPQVIDHAFKPAYDNIPWRKDEEGFERWCNGTTGYPIVDAGMRELNATGFMHNRVRMVTASFLCKHLLINWRLGEAYFAEKLLDFDLASNNGGWQWSAGSGCDAAPYFRIFNPYLQTKRFDPEFKYIRRWVPEFEEFTYPQPIVDHEFARKRCLEVYSKAINEK